MSVDRLKGLRVKTKEKIGGLFWRISFPLFSLVLLTFVATYYQVQEFKTAANSYAFIAWCSPFLGKHVLGVSLWSVAISFILSNIHSWLDMRAWDSSKLDTHVLTALDGSLETVIKAKYDRFALHFKEYNRSSRFPSPGTVFKSITKPEQQIALLGHALYTFFSTTNPKVSFKVRIVEIKDMKPLAWFSYAPHNSEPRTPIDVLQNENSALSVCLRRKALVIIEDIKKAAAQNTPSYVMSHNEANDEIGSLICFPLYHEPSKCYPYVVTVSADRAFFRISNAEYYHWVMNKFAIRMQLEHSLLLIKERNANEQ